MGTDKLSVPFGLMASIIVVKQDITMQTRISFELTKVKKKGSPISRMINVVTKKASDPIYVFDDFEPVNKLGQKPELRLSPVIDAAGSLKLSINIGKITNEVLFNIIEI